MYDCEAWRKARAHFLREHPLCVACSARGRVRAAVAVDHIKPHREDLALFWNQDNWQGLCTRCHNAKTAAGG